MNTQLFLRRIPDHWFTKVNRREFRKKYTFVRDQLKRVLLERRKDSGKRKSGAFVIEESGDGTNFNNFCVIVTKAILFRELYRYLFPYGGASILWNNSVLSKLAGKTNREIFFLTQRNPELFEASRKLI